MRVYFIKESPEKYRLERVREDGSRTSASREFRGCFKHDLMHFVGERAAGLQDSFFGLVSRGRNLGELRRAGHQNRRARIPGRDSDDRTRGRRAARASKLKGGPWRSRSVIADEI